MISLDINGKNYQVNVSPDTPLLWVIRDHLKMTGTKYGCGIAQCGACTVHIDDSLPYTFFQAVRRRCYHNSKLPSFTTIMSFISSIRVEKMAKIAAKL